MMITITLSCLEELNKTLKSVINQLENFDTMLYEPKFYTVEEVSKLTGWSLATAQKLFNRDDFPSCNFGKKKIVEREALIKYFQKPRRKKESWK